MHEQGSTVNGDHPQSVVVMGASAGGVEALTRVAADLPTDLAAPVLVVLHLPPSGRSRLPQILSRAGPLPATTAAQGERLEAGRIYVAPPDRHLLLEDGAISLVRGPRENLARPAIDPLFRSAAVAYGPRVVAVVLSGSRADGVAGARAVSRRGGAVIVQDPDEAIFAEMPMNAIARDHPDLVLPLGRIGAAIGELVAGGDLSREMKMRDDNEDEMSLEASYAALEIDAVERDQPPGDLTPFSCPECGGALWEIREPDLPRYRCRVGHAYTAESVFEDQSAGVDRALWVALRALLERAALSERVSGRIRRANGSTATAERFDRLADEAHAQAAVIRDVLLERDATTP
jgi:two-component system, chemotaxis family, protein-glutamate methylesterase/glutaminase